MKSVSELRKTLDELTIEARKLSSALIYTRHTIEDEDYEDITSAVEMAEGFIFRSLEIIRGEA